MEKPTTNYKEALNIMRQRWVIYFIFALVMTGCSSQSNNTITQPAIIPTFIPIPLSLSVQVNQDVEPAADSATNIQALISAYIERNNTFETIQLSSITLFRKNLGYVLGKYSQTDQLYIVVTFPSNFQISTYNISQLLNTAPSYIAANPALPAAVIRNLPQNLSPFGEPETEGEACDQSVSGQLTISNKQPLQGNFQFRCQFQDGRWASVAGTFSQ